MNNEISLEVSRVAKKFSKNLSHLVKYSFADISRSLLGLKTHSDKLRQGEFWALKNVSFRLKRGETLGLIGPNGSGKTTLLRLVSGVLNPDKGKIVVRGRVGSLIELGAGFHPLLTGRENIYINGAILGMTKQEIKNKFDDIVKFADLGKFLDAPVKTYSSGMFVRLGFSVAVHSEPDILLVDEVLAVGDIAFQNKCLERIAQIRQSASIILVSHNMNTIQLMCDRCLFLNKGKVVKIGKTSQVLDLYTKNIFGLNEKKFQSENLDIEVLDQNLLATNNLVVNRKCQFKFTLKQLILKKGLLVAFSFVNLSNNFSHRIEIKKFSKIKGKIEKFAFCLGLEELSLPPGDYTIRLCVSDGSFLRRIFQAERTIVFKVKETEKERFLNPVIRKG